MNFFIISQIMVVIAYIVLGIGLSMKKYSQIMASTIAYSSLMIIHFSLLGGTMGLIANSINLCRNIIFKYNDSHGKKNGKIIIGLFYLSTIALTIFFYNTPIDIFPCLLALLGTYAYSHNDKTKRVRICNIICSICYIIYAIHFRSYMNILCESYLVIQTVRGYIKYEKSPESE